MTAAAFVADLQQRGLSLAATDGALRVQGPKGLLTEDLRAQLAALKPDLLAYLSRPQALADTAAPERVNVTRLEEGPGAALAAPTVPTSLPPSPGTVAAPQDHKRTLPPPTRRYAYLSAWLHATYLNQGEGTGSYTDLSTEEKDECRRRGKAWLSGADDPAGTEELAEWLGTPVTQLRALHGLLRTDQQQPNFDAAAEALPASSSRWSLEAQALIDWFNEWEGTSEVFSLGPGVKVTDPHRFIATLRGDVAAGIRGPRARYGALQTNLRTLHELFGPRAGTGS